MCTTRRTPLRPQPTSVTNCAGFKIAEIGVATTRRRRCVRGSGIRLAYAKNVSNVVSWRRLSLAHGVQSLLACAAGRAYENASSGDVSRRLCCGLRPRSDAAQSSTCGSRSVLALLSGCGSDSRAPCRNKESASYPSSVCFEARMPRCKNRCTIRMKGSLRVVEGKQISRFQSIG